MWAKVDRIARVMIFVIVLSNQALLLQAANGGQIPSLGSSISWSGSHVLQGRDLVDGAGVLSADCSIAYQEFLAGIRLDYGPGPDYRELSVYVERGAASGPWSAYLRYAHIEYQHSSESDDQLVVAAAVEVLPYIRCMLRGSYWMANDGVFLDTTVQVEVPCPGNRITLTPYISQGVDVGYVTEDYVGVNSFSMGLAVDVRVLNWLDLTASGAHNLVNGDMRNADVDDITWATIGVRAGF